MPPKIDQFVPLVPTMPSTESREFHITVIPQGEQMQSFQTLQNGVPATGDPVLPKRHGGPNLSLLRDASGQITHIKIHCTCGQLIDVECIYKGAAKAEAPPKAAAPAKPAEPPKAKAPPKAEKAKAVPKAGKAAKKRK